MDKEQDIKRTKKRVKWGCLIWVVILIFGPIILFVGYFHYQTEIKERTLLVSRSPNDTNTIKIVEKGEPFFSVLLLSELNTGISILTELLAMMGKRSMIPMPL